MIATIVLIMPAEIIKIALSLLGIIILTIYSLTKKVEINIKSSNRINIVISLAISLFFGMTFFRTWMYSSKVMFIANILHVNLYLFLGLISILGIITSLPFIITILSKMVSKIEYSSLMDCDQKITIKQKLLILITAVIVITIFSKSSFLYPFNDWVDSNCFMTVGKSILQGKVPYLDLFEQKGPLLYCVHAFAAIISSTSFIGVYLIEIIACYFFLYYSYKILILYTDKNIIYLLPVLSFFIYSSTNFCHGDSAEELCLPLLSYALYVGIKLLKFDDIPSFKESLMIGITSSCVLWIKYSMLGFYIGWIIIPGIKLIKKGKVKELIRMIMVIALGVIITTIPIIIYFLFNDALKELFTVYFYNNMFLYNDSSQSIPVITTLHNALNALGLWLDNNKIVALSVIFGILLLIKDKLIFSNILVLFAFTSLFVFMNTTSYLYYSFILNVFSCFVLIPVYRLLNNHRILKTILLYLTVIIVSISQSSNVYLLFEHKNNLPQYKFKEIICREENPTLLNYGFLDGGFYTVCDIVPNCKYFCQLNINIDEMYQGQNQCIEQGLVKFVVTRNKKIEDEKYGLVSTATYYFEGNMYEYNLYQLK